MGFRRLQPNVLMAHMHIAFVTDLLWVGPMLLIESRKLEMNKTY